MRAQERLPSPRRLQVFIDAGPFVFGICFRRLPGRARRRRRASGEHVRASCERVCYRRRSKKKGGGGWETKDPPESIKRSRYPRLQECEWSVNNTNQTNTETNKKQQNRWNESYVIHELKEPQKTRRNEPDMFIWIGNLEAARRKCFKNDFYLSSMPRSRLKNSSRRGLMGRSVSTAIRRLVKTRVQPNAGGCSSKWDIFN